MQKAKNLQHLHKGVGSRNVQTPRAAESEAQGSRLQAEFVRNLCLERLLHRVLPLQSRSGWGKGAKGLGRWEPRGEAGTAGDPGHPQCGEGAPAPPPYVPQGDRPTGCRDTWQSLGSLRPPRRRGRSRPGFPPALTGLQPADKGKPQQ